IGKTGRPLQPRARDSSTPLAGRLKNNFVKCGPGGPDFPVPALSRRDRIWTPWSPEWLDGFALPGEDRPSAGSKTANAPETTTAAEMLAAVHVAMEYSTQNPKCG